MDFKDWMQQMRHQPVVYRPIEQKSRLQRISDMINAIKQWFVVLVIFLIGMAVLGAVLSAWERIEYRKHLLEKDIVIEVESGREVPVKR